MKQIEFRIKVHIIAIFVLYSIFLPLNSIQAAEPTSTPSASAKTKLQALKDEIASKAAQIKSEISKKLQNRAYIGFVKSKSDKSLTLATKSGTKIVSLNQDTEYLSEIKPAPKVKFSLKTLLEEDYLIALGDIDESSVLTAKKVIKVSSLSEPEIRSTWGEVTSVSSNQITIKLKNDSLETSAVDSKTTILFGEDPTTISAIKVGKPVVITGPSTDNKITKVRTVFVFPYVLSPSEKVSTPSATPILKSSPTGKKLTPTPTKKPV